MKRMTKSQNQPAIKNREDLVRSNSFLRINSTLLLMVLLVFLFSVKCVAQESVHWRVWNDVDVLHSRYIRASPSEKIWTIFETAKGFGNGWFDGYTVDALPLIESDLSRSFPLEDRFGQIWTLDIDMISYQIIGFSRYVSKQTINEGNWIHYPIEEIESFIPPEEPYSGLMCYAPGVKERVLLLSSKGLIEYNAETKQTSFLKTIEQTNLGRFIHMAEAKDGGLWITSENGLAKVTGGLTGGLPTVDSVYWQEFVFPPELELQDSAIPIEVDPGEVFFTASHTGNSRRILVRFNGGKWQIVPLSGEQQVIMGWAWWGWPYLGATKPDDRGSICSLWFCQT